MHFKRCRFLTLHPVNDYLCIPLVNSSIMSFNGLISVSRAVQISNSMVRFREILWEDSGYCYKDAWSLERALLLEKGYSKDTST